MLVRPLEQRFLRETTDATKERGYAGGLSAVLERCDATKKALTDGPV